MDLMLKPAQTDQESGRGQLFVKSHSLVFYAMMGIPKRCICIENRRDLPAVIMGYDSYEQNMGSCALGLTCRALNRVAKPT